MINYPYPSTLARGGFRIWKLALATCLLVLTVQSASAATVASHNLVDLLDQSEQILFATVGDVSDGFNDQGVPYTEIKLHVRESLKGNAGEDYTFRQFGLLKPRKMPNGKTYLGVSPNGFPRWIRGENVMAFMFKPARLTGLQTTVGLEQGKLQLFNGKFSSTAGNKLFDNVVISANDLSSEQKAMLSNTNTAVDATPFVELVRRAVSENWTSTGVMRNED